MRLAQLLAVASGPQAAGFTATESDWCIPSHRSLHLWRRPTGKPLARAGAEFLKVLSIGNLRVCVAPARVLLLGIEQSSQSRTPALRHGTPREERPRAPGLDRE